MDGHEHSGHGGDESVSERRESKLRIAIGLNVVIVVVQAIFGVLAHSLGLLADAGHNVTDAAAVLLSLVAVRFARRKPTGQRSFGYHRGTILAAQANATLLLAASAFVIYEAVDRLRNPSPVRGGIVVVVALVATAVNLIAALTLHESGASHGGSHTGHNHGDTADLNMRSAFLHMVGDAAASLGVALAGLTIFLTGRFDWLDPVVSIVVSLLIAWQSWKLLRATNDVLLESTPAGLDIAELSAAIAAVDGVEDVHDLHVWSLSSEIRALSAHVVLTGDPSLASAQEVAAAVKQVIGPRFAIAHATLELEGSSCAASGAWCAMHQA